MTDMFVSLGTWNWLIFGFILMALEVIAPGVFLFWLGLAALLVGLISFAAVISWQIQLEAGRSWSATVEHRVTVAAERGRESVSP